MNEKNTLPDEKELVAQLKDESKRSVAFSVIINRYSEKLYWLIRRMITSHDDTNDILQNTFLKAWSNIDKFRGDAQISTWLHRIAVNETLNFISKNSENTIPIDSPEGEIARNLESDIYFCGNHADALFQEAVSRLPEKQRLVFTMKYFQDMKYEEISQIVDTSVGALKASYHLAVKKIETFLQERD